MLNVQAQASGGFTSYRIEADDLEELEDAVSRIEANYHPLGYGTNFDPPYQRADGSWATNGWRANSCD